MVLDGASPNFDIQIKEELVISDLNTLKIFCDETRHQILKAVSDAPRTVGEIAPIIGMTGHNLYYHIGLLEKAGLIYQAGEQPGSGAITQKYYHVAARVFRVNPDLLRFAPLEEHAHLELRMTAIFDEAQSDVRYGLNGGAIRPDAEPPHPLSALIDRRLARLSPQDAERVYRQIDALFSAFEHDEAHGKNFYALSVVLHPIGTDPPNA